MHLSCIAVIFILMCRLGTKQPALCMQYVFVLLRGEGFYVGGHLWRSDQFGNGNWQDVTSKLTGQLLLLATAVSAGIVGHRQRHKLQTNFIQHLHASSVSSDLCSHQLRVLLQALLKACFLA
jgi:hypothetical protein